MTKDWLENIISQLPALALLQKMGYEYLTAQAALAKGGGKRSRIVPEEREVWMGKNSM
jgi:type I restriction enzyme, R subunit